MRPSEKLTAVTLIALLVFGVVVRIVLSVQGTIGLRAIPADEIREQLRLSRTDPDLSGLCVDHFTLQRFDSGAVVVMRPGADRQPGFAGVDDNGNGTIDDLSELGATGSDDLCVVADAVAAQQLPEPLLILQRGAFVPAQLDHLSGDDQARVVVYGQFGDDRWSFLVERQ